MLPPTPEKNKTYQKHCTAKCTEKAGIKFISIFKKNKSNRLTSDHVICDILLTVSPWQPPLHPALDDL